MDHDDSPMPAPTVAVVPIRVLRAYERLAAEVKRAYRPALTGDGELDWHKPKLYRECVPVAQAALELDVVMADAAPG